jgi:hypothetical protein
MDGAGNILSSDGGIQIESHVPDSGIWFVKCQLPPGARDAGFSVQPGSEIRPGQTAADDVQFEVNHLGVSNGFARYQVLGFDSTTKKPVPDAQIIMLIDWQPALEQFPIYLEAQKEF